MASITQTIPSYIGGISQQPDQLKVPGQLNVAKNVMPDITEGLSKRPGSRFIKLLATQQPTNGVKWFSYYRDETEQYIGRIVLDSGVIDMWDKNGNAKTVVYDSTDETAIKNYLKQTSNYDESNLQLLTLNDNTYITNRTKTVAMSNTGKTAAKPAEAFIELKNISYASQYSLNLFDNDTLYEEETVTRLDIEKDIDSKNSGKDDIHSGGDDDMGQGPPKGILPGSRHSNTTGTHGRYVHEFTRIAGAPYWDPQGGPGFTTVLDDSMCPNVGTDIYQINAGDPWKSPKNNSNYVGGVTLVNRDGTWYVNGECHESASFSVGSGNYTIVVDPGGIGDSITVGGASNFDTFIENIRAHSNYDSSKYIIQRAGWSQPSSWGGQQGSPGPAYNKTMGRLQVIFKEHTGTKSASTLDGTAMSRTTTNISPYATDFLPTTYTYIKNDAIRPKDLNFRITCLGQSATGGNATNSKYTCRYNYSIDLLHGGSGWKVDDYFYIWHRNARYKITVAETSISKQQANLGMIRPNPTPFDAETVITAQSILGDIRKAILDYDATVNTESSPPNPNALDDWVDWDESNGYGIKQIGNGLYIRRKDNTDFGISSPVGELLNVFSESVNTVEDLPQQCRHGYVVKVANSEADEDDYWLKFYGDNDKDGTGVWEECAAPNLQVQFDYSTLPVTLIRTADGNFRVSQVDGSTYAISGTNYTVPVWSDRKVGDAITNPEPSFVGKTISKLLFWRNRFVFLSDENVIMSRPGSFFDFWNKTALTFTVSDPIDLSCTSDKPAVVKDGLQVNNGLVLFTETSQFMVTTDSDVLSPQTAKINFLSSFTFNSKTNPISIGTTVGFLDNAGKNTRFWEIARIVRDGEPIVVDQSKVVSKLFNKDLRLISNSKENSIIIFSERNKPTLYVYKYFTQGERRVQAAWFTWELSGNIQYHTILDDALYVVLRNGNNDSVQRFDLKLHDATRTITDDMDTSSDTTDDITYRVHLDNSISIAIASNAYNDTTKETTFAIPTGFFDETNALAKAALYDTSAGSGDTDPIGMFGEARIVGSNFVVDGDWSGNTVILGYLFDMELEFPTIYRTQQSGDSYRSDIQSTLVLHRAKLNFGEAGMFDTVLERRGKPTYTETWERPSADWYRANQLDIASSITQTVPLYERNTNLTLTLKSSHPSPLTLFSMTWEGDYNNKFYRRV